MPTDPTIAALVAKYGPQFEGLGSQRWLLISLLATDGMEDDGFDIGIEAARVSSELEYLDAPARAGLIIAIAQGLLDD